MGLYKRDLSLRRKVMSITSVFLITFMVGCSARDASKSTETTPSKVINTPLSSAPTSNNGSTTNSNSTSVKGDPTDALLLNIMKFAKQGKVINSVSPAKTTVIEDVEKKWGKPDKTDWIPAAKGNYATYSKRKVTFGYNKGSQIFEVRSFDDKLKSLSISKIKKVYGTPAYDIKTKSEEIIGYVANKEFKLLFVFPIPTIKKTDHLLGHYSVLYPRGTVNSMADDPGRQW